MRAFHEHLEFDSNFPIKANKGRGFNFRAHWHAEVELVYVCDGQFRIGINSEVKILNSGDIAICNSGDIHYYDSAALNSTVIIIIFKPDLVDSHSHEYWPNTICFESPFITHTQIENITSYSNLTGKIKDIFYSCFEESQNKKEFSNLFIKSKLIEFCAISSRYFSSPLININNTNKNHRLSNLYRMQEALDYLEHNYMNDINLSKLANNLNLSTFHFSRIFKSIYGMNFRPFLNTIRVEKAVNLIINTDMPITDIALECGFGSIRSFNRAFKDINGKVPSDLR